MRIKADPESTPALEYIGLEPFGDFSSLAGKITTTSRIISILAAGAAAYCNYEIAKTENNSTIGIGLYTGSIVGSALSLTLPFIDNYVRDINQERVISKYKTSLQIIDVYPVSKEAQAQAIYELIDKKEISPENQQAEIDSQIVTVEGAITFHS